MIIESLLLRKEITSVLLIIRGIDINKCNHTIFNFNNIDKYFSTISCFMNIWRNVYVATSATIIH